MKMTWRPSQLAFEQIINKNGTMSRTLHFFAGHLIPRRRTQYYRDYLEEVGAINRARKSGADAERRRLAAKHWAVIALLLTHSLHNLWLLFAYPARLSNRELLLHYDMPVIELGNVMFNAIWFAFGPLCAVMHRDYYLRSDDRILALIDGILFRRWCSLFAANRYRGKEPCDFLRIAAIQAVGYFQKFILFLHINNIYLHFHSMDGSFERLNVSFRGSLLDYFWYYLNGFKFYAFLYEFASILILAGTVMGLVACSNYVMFKLANRVLLDHRQYGVANCSSLTRRLAADWLRFHRFHHYFVETLRHFLYANAWTGKSFAAVLAVNFPLNAYIVMFLLTSELPTRKMLGPGVLVIGQLIALFGLHLVLSIFSTHIHRPSKPLMGLMAQQHFRSTMLKMGLRKSGPRPNYIRDQIRLSLCIGAINTNNRYGTTYGKCGLASIATFTKCLMFYGKFMMISYKNIRKIK